MAGCGGLSGLWLGFMVVGLSVEWHSLVASPGALRAEGLRALRSHLSHLWRRCSCMYHVTHLIKFFEHHTSEHSKAPVMRYISTCTAISVCVLDKYVIDVEVFTLK